jgi:hypothetical protein
MRWWYESLADYMITNPSATQNEIAAHFGRHPATISTILSTDAFKAYYRQRRNQHTENLDHSVRQKLFKIADASLDHMLTALEKKRDSVPLDMLQRTSDMALKNLGYGAAPQASTTVNVNTAPTSVNVAVSLDDLERARAALRRNQESPPLTIDHEAPPLGAGLVTDSAPLGGQRDPDDTDIDTEPPVATLKDLA